MEPTLHLHEFFVEGNDPQISHVLLNITEPSNPAEKSKGYFFAIYEINNAETKYIAKMQKIIDQIEDDYYEIPDQIGQTAMEIVLEKVNQESLSIVQPDISLHCIVGAIRENDIIFSFYGQPQMLLFYKTKDGFYKKMDLVEQNKTNEHTYEPDGSQQNQLFSQIVQGKIGPNDFFFAGTPHIIDYFNHDRLQKIITTRPPQQSAEHVQKVLSEIKNDLSFGGIIINLQEDSEMPAPIKTSPVKKGSSAKSLKNLFNRERNTAHTLSPSFLPNLQDVIDETSRKEYSTSKNVPSEEIMGTRTGANISSSHLHARTTKTGAPNQKTNGANLLDFIKKTAWFIWKIIRWIIRGLALIFLFAGAILSAIGKNLLLLFFVITNYKNRRHNILAEWSRWWKNLKENTKRLPLITKILLILCLILLLVFSSGIIYIRAKQKKEAHATLYTNTVQNIKIKSDAAESSLVYNDTEAALASIKEAGQAIKTLSCLTPLEKTACKNLQDRLDTLLIKARKTTIVHPQLLTDWNGLTQDIKINKIFLLNNRLYGFGPTSSNLTIYDPLVKESKLLTPNIDINGITAVSVPKENDYAILLYGNKNIAQFKPDDSSWKKADIDYPNQNALISNISIYNRRLYSVDTQNNQIYKHDSIKSGFSLGKEWLKNNTADLKTSIDLALDGDVFVLGTAGSINKFTSGSNEPFAISGLDPALTSADEIWTYNDLIYIYILDTANKRIIVLDKTGVLKTQITAEEFTHPESMIIDEQKGLAYVLNNNKVYLVEL